MTPVVLRSPRWICPGDLELVDGCLVDAKVPISDGDPQASHGHLRSTRLNAGHRLRPLRLSERLTFEAVESFERIGHLVVIPHEQNDRSPAGLGDRLYGTSPN